MEVYNPRGISHELMTQMASKQRHRDVKRILLINNRRPSAYPIMPALLMRLQEQAYEVELIEAQRDEDVSQIRRVASGFDIAVIGVGD